MDPDPGPTFQFDADPDSTILLCPDLDLLMLQNDPLMLPPYYFDADPDPAFHFRIRIRNTEFTIIVIYIFSSSQKN